MPRLLYNYKQAMKESGVEIKQRTDVLENWRTEDYETASDGWPPIRQHKMKVAR
jgi:hypothetical protein